MGIIVNPKDMSLEALKALAFDLYEGGLKLQNDLNIIRNEIALRASEPKPADVPTSTEEPKPTTDG